MKQRRASLCKHFADDTALNEELQSLRSNCGRLATALHGSQVAGSYAAVQQPWGQHIRRRDRILDRQIDPDAADRRHCVRCVADAEQSVPVPPPQAIDTNREQLDVVPAAEFADAVGEKRNDGADLSAKLLEAARLVLL